MLGLDANPTTLLFTLAAGILTLRPVMRYLRSYPEKDIPIVYTLFQPFGIPGVLLPTTRRWTTGLDWMWIRRGQTYTTNETIRLVPLLAGDSELWTCDMDVARQTVVGSHRSSWVKPAEMSRLLLIWGMNIVAADGQVWRKHRRIMGPAFGTELYQLVWKESIRLYREMISVEEWESESAAKVPVVQELTLKFAFLVICRCGFGFPSSWADPPKSSDTEMSAQEALRIVSNSHMIKNIMPLWMLRLLPFPKIQAVRTAHDIFLQFMRFQIDARKEMVRESEVNEKDAFTMLIQANEDEAGKNQLDESELIGNIYILMFAGHETTAQSLASTLAYLALDESLQDELLNHILDVVGPSGDPVYEDHHKLNKIAAAFFEGTRLFPSAQVLIRQATEDTLLTVQNALGEEGTRKIPVTQGTLAIVDMVGVQYNPRYFEDPTAFKPSRWYDLPVESDIFSGFSVGPRACLGRKFATVEAICFLSLLIRDWKVSPLLNSDESISQWKARVLDARFGMTLRIADVPVRFERRKHGL
ncbi:unnamed protein product [Mycena citricolor]|uniref:Cytochrome P450 n=1 Tax=Mycena citricolor TaxID=2018698 RepID=A0AAD2GQU0_9AGAR|nr:unnamed protein product [Mycena citricolor]